MIANYTGGDGGEGGEWLEAASPLNARAARLIAMRLSRVPQSPAEFLLSAALAIALLIFCINLARI